MLFVFYVFIVIILLLGNASSAEVILIFRTFMIT
jgi:hypothetical protein